VLLSSVLNWFKGGGGEGTSGFDVPLSFLFDSRTTTLDPKLGLALLAIGGVAVVAAFVPAIAGLRRVAGGLAIAVTALFCTQTQDLISDSALSLTDAVDVGAWVCGAAGIALVVLPKGRRATT
jgi:hypothetical protein